MKTIYNLWALSAPLGFLVGAGCWGVAEGHCGNLGGDQRCAELGSGPYCDACRLENNGCTDVMPSADCHSVGTEGATSIAGETSGTTLPSDTSNTTAPVDTTYTTAADGTMVTLSGESGTTGGSECVSDAECEGPGESFCGKNGECVASCGETADPDAACTGLGMMTPLCSGGECVACEDRLLVSDSTTGSCVPCIEHYQCESGACDIFVGTCFDPESVVEVGLEGAPFAIANALASVGEDRLGERRGVLVLHDHNHEQSQGQSQGISVDFQEMATVDASYDAIAFVAAPREPQFPVWSYQDGSAPAPTLTVTGDATRGYLDGIFMRNNTNASPLDEPSLHCVDARVDIRRSRLVHNDGGGIEALGQCELVVQNSFIGADDNGIDAVLIADDTVTATILYSTLVGADDASAALRCLSQEPNVHVRNSLLVSISSAPIVCSSATPMASATETGMMIMDWFSSFDDADFHLSDDAPADIIVADWLPGDPVSDIDGNPRVTAEGQLGYAGADVHF